MVVMHVGQETGVRALGNASDCFSFLWAERNKVSLCNEDDSGADGDLSREKMRKRLTLNDPEKWTSSTNTTIVFCTQ